MGIRRDPTPPSQPKSMAEIATLLKTLLVTEVGEIEASDIERAQDGGSEFYVSLPIEDALGARYSSYVISVGVL